MTRYRSSSGIGGRIGRDLARLQAGQDVDRARRRLAVNSAELILKPALKTGLPSPLVEVAFGVAHQILGPQLFGAGDLDTVAYYDEDGERDFGKWLDEFEYGVITVVGAPRSGKTTLLCRMADLWLPEHQALREGYVPIQPPPSTFIVNYPSGVLRGTPLKRLPWRIDDLFALKAGDVVLMPDAGIYLNSRHFSGDATEDVAELLPTLAGHLKIRMPIDVQTTSILGKGALMSRASIYKPMPQNYEALEREQLLRRAQTAMDAFTQCSGCGHGSRRHEGKNRCRGGCLCRGYSPRIPVDERKGWAFVFCDEIGYSGLIRTRIRPPWYSLRLSEAHAEQDLEDIFGSIGRKGRKAAAKPKGKQDTIIDLGPEDYIVR